MYLQKKQYLIDFIKKNIYVFTSAFSIDPLTKTRKLVGFVFIFSRIN